MFCGKQAFERHSSIQSVDFLVNAVKGQTDEFTVSAGDALTSPAIAIGSNSRTIAIGWQQTSGTTGIWARRFPAPLPP